MTTIIDKFPGRKITVAVYQFNENGEIDPSVEPWFGDAWSGHQSSYNAPDSDGIKYEIGFFVTEAELEAYITKAWEAAREGDDYCDHCNEGRQWRWGNVYTWIKERER